MAGAYSTDLRERVLLAVEGGGTPEAVARRFAVGRSTAYRWLEAAREEGRRSAKPMEGGPKPKISGEVEAALRGVLAESNRLSLAATAWPSARGSMFTSGRWGERCAGWAGRERS